jgi:hypothetical protein
MSAIKVGLIINGALRAHRIELTDPHNDRKHRL